MRPSRFQSPPIRLHARVRRPSRAVARRGLRLPASALVLALVLLVAACAPPGQDEEVDQAEIQSLLEEYLPMLGRAYAERDAGLIEPWAVPKEVARIALRIEELEAQSQVYEPSFESVEVEGVSVWNYSNAFVTTSEIWDVAAYTLGSHQLVNQVEDQRSKVKYQLKRKDDGWVVLYRELEETSDS